MNNQAAKALLVLLNLFLSRIQNDPISLQKIQNGEPLDMDDMDRLDDSREAARHNLDEAIDSALEGFNP